MFCEDCGEVYLRESSHQCGDARVDPSPDAGAQPVMTDGGRPGVDLEEAEAVAGPETRTDQYLEGKRQALDEVHGRDGVEERGDGQPATGEHFGGR